MEFPKVADGVAKIASLEDEARNAVGYTNPNLHRVVDAAEPDPSSGEVAPRSYTLGVFDSVHSLKLVQTYVHDEESETDETP